MKYKKHVNDLEQECVLGYLTTFGFLKRKDTKNKELEQELGNPSFQILQSLDSKLRWLVKLLEVLY